MMRNMAGIMKKMHEMQDQLAAMKVDLAVMEFTAIVDGGTVCATVAGDGKLTGLKLDPTALESRKTEVLEDMICLATNNASDKANDEKARMIKKITGGLPLPPGINLPF